MLLLRRGARCPAPSSVRGPTQHIPRSRRIYGHRAQPGLRSISARNSKPALAHEQYLLSRSRSLCSITLNKEPPGRGQAAIHKRSNNSILTRVVHAYVLCISTPTVRGTPAARRFSKQTQRHVCCDNNPIRMRARLRDRDPGRGCRICIIITGAGGVFSIWGRQRCLTEVLGQAHKPRRRRRTWSRRQ